MHRKRQWTGWRDDFGCRTSAPILACTAIVGPMFFAAVAPYSVGASVRFKLPERFVEKSNLGMRKVAKRSSNPKGTLRSMSNTVIRLTLAM